MAKHKLNSDEETNHSSGEDQNDALRPYLKLKPTPEKIRISLEKTRERELADEAKKKAARSLENKAPIKQQTITPINLPTPKPAPQPKSPQPQQQIIPGQPIPNALMQALLRYNNGVIAQRSVATSPIQSPNQITPTHAPTPFSMKMKPKS